MDHGVHVAEILADAYAQHCCVTDHGDAAPREKAVQLGFSLGESNGFHIGDARSSF